MLGRCTLDLDLVQDNIMFDSVSCSAMGLLSSNLLWYMHGFESSSVAAASMCLDSLKFFGCTRTLQKGLVLVLPCREARRYLTLL
ncbi:hypothetical protein M9H77_22173 [Catharanthus roseus]|uniref:Uncharacterized protein n=1 Tax=Catharanthus roseus TaxID=4058 RepID=A0ACC0AR74_CATRO|nr:hypothetical protein M9H77_22173 [Catharanthus roseus]